MAGWGSRASSPDDCESFDEGPPHLDLTESAILPALQLPTRLDDPFDLSLLKIALGCITAESRDEPSGLTLKRSRRSTFYEFLHVVHVLTLQAHIGPIWTECSISRKDVLLIVRFGNIVDQQ